MTALAIETAMESPPEGELTLDPRSPEEWEALRALRHRMVDDMLAHLAGARERPAWRPVPEDVKARLRGGVPREGAGAEAAYSAFRRDVLPYPPGNTHPCFWGWVTGTGTPLGMLAEMLSAGMNATVSAQESAPGHVEAQVLDWTKALLGLPADASGLLVSGASEANLVALAAARNARLGAAAGVDVHRAGVRALPASPVLYGSDQTHASVDKAAALLGLGADAVRRIETDDAFRIRLDRLEAAIDEDRAAGRAPFAVVGGAGTVATGATDDLEALADLAARHGLWFHVDGAFGAWAALSDALRPALRGIERADSIAVDYHKWMYQPYEVAAVLVRDPAAHRAGFNAAADGGTSYLAGLPRGTSAAEHPFNLYGVQLSRAFKALKVWMSLQADGVDRYARLVEQNVAQAAYLAARVDAHPALERLAPAPLNIVCFRYAGRALPAAALDAANAELLMRLQERGVTVPSMARVRGAFALRVAVTNHRSRRADFDALMEAVVAIGDEIALEGEAGH
jgi:aromatic-L-amino-acid/L-tryptophan decarboxylase